MIKIDAAHLVSVGANTQMWMDLKRARQKLQQRMDLEYAANSYDKNSEFIFGSTLRAGMAIGGDFLGSRFGVHGTPYFSKSKNDYMDRIGDNTFDLLFLQYMDANKIRVADRQQIYRLRRDILRTFSKDEAQMRTLLMLAAAGYAFTNETELLDLLQAAEVIF